MEAHQYVVYVAYRHEIFPEGNVDILGKAGRKAGTDNAVFLDCVGLPDLWETVELCVLYAEEKQRVTLEAICVLLPCSSNENLEKMITNIEIAFKRQIGSSVNLSKGTMNIAGQDVNCVNVYGYIARTKIKQAYFRK